MIHTSTCERQTTDDSSLAERILLSTSSFSSKKIKERKAEKLVNKLEEIMPEVNFIEDFSWGGTFGTTKDGLPYIGKSPEFENTLFVLGFGGNGITFSVQGMEMIKNFLQGKVHKLAEYYRFGR
ncbi:FAD-dependent oxidoreductase [Algoriphagus boritolerans]|uniref:FAD-dependent oxidoreductase n=1 Tax=Algoriphagus boritolerans TaxID=308111 RepID=UPI000A9322BB